MFNRQTQFALAGFANFILFSSAAPLLANDIPSVFHIAKNDNANQVHYGIRLNQNCVPIANKPVYVYWQKEDGTTRELMQIEQAGYGIFSQSVSSTKVDILLNALHSRGIQKLISFKPVKLNNGSCQASAFTSINGKSRQLTRLYILLSNINRNPFTGGTIGGRIINLTLISSTKDGKNEEVILCTSDCRFGF